MKILNVPEDLFGTNVEEISIKSFESDKDISKNKICFSQNVLTFILEGEKKMFHNNEPITMIGNDCAFINSTHCIMSERTSSKTGTYKALVLFFSNNILTQFILEYLGNEKLKNCKTRNYISVFKSDNYISLFRNSLMELATNKRDLSMDFLKIKVNEIMIYLIERYPDKILPFLFKNKNDCEIQFKSVIEKNIYSKLTNSELAFLCNMSLSTFNRHFKNYYKATPNGWFLTKRMDYAHFLLGENKMAIDIFDKVGYTTLSNFVKAYKNYFSVTPKKQYLTS